MRRFLVGGVCCVSVFCAALVTLNARTDTTSLKSRGWWHPRGTLTIPRQVQAAQSEAQSGRSLLPGHLPPLPPPVRDLREGQRLFERETFGGNGRTCLTCHSRETGTVSPKDARIRFHRDRDDALFVHDGSDDEDGDGLGDGRHVTRMLKDATILMRIRLHDDVEVKGHPEVRVVTVRRGIPTTQNTPALDPVLMLDGRQPSLQAQALGAITDHAQATRTVKQKELDLIAKFQQTAPQFFSSFEVARFAFTGQHPPELPRGRTPSEKRGRLFFEDRPPDFSVTPPNFKVGACAACHSGPLLNQTNQFLPLPVPPGTRFQTALVSEFNDAGNPVIDFVFRNQANDLNPSTNQDLHPDGIVEVSSPDPGRALITGRADDFAPFPGTFDHLNAFKISQLRGIKDTAPYFHDNSSKTLEDVVDHYRRFFLIVSDPDGPGPDGPLIVLDDQDKRDIVAFLKLL